MQRQWANRRAGFTIVELLIVVVVIAILAAITIVSYNGITSQANDASLESTAKQVEKKIRATQIVRGSDSVVFRSNLYGPEQLPGSREMLLDGYDSVALADATCIEFYVMDGNDGMSHQDAGCFPAYVINQVPQFNKKKVYLSALYDTTTSGGETTYVSYSYWSNDKKAWVIKEITKAPNAAEVNATQDNACTPVRNPSNGPAYSMTFPIYDVQCRYTGP